MEILIIFLLMILNGLFAMSEMAVIFSRKTRLQHWAREGNTGAKTALELAENPNRFLSTIQVGITLDRHPGRGLRRDHSSPFS